MWFGEEGAEELHFAATLDDETYDLVERKNSRIMEEYLPQGYEVVLQQMLGAEAGASGAEPRSIVSEDYQYVVLQPAVSALW